MTYKAFGLLIGAVVLAFADNAVAVGRQYPITVGCSLKEPPVTGILEMPETSDMICKRNYEPNNSWNGLGHNIKKPIVVSFNGHSFALDHLNTDLKDWGASIDFRGPGCDMDKIVGLGANVNGVTDAMTGQRLYLNLKSIPGGGYEGMIGDHSSGITPCSFKTQ